MTVNKDGGRPDEAQTLGILRSLHEHVPDMTNTPTAGKGRLKSLLRDLPMRASIEVEQAQVHGPIMLRPSLRRRSAGHFGACKPTCGVVASLRRSPTFLPSQS